MQPSKHLRTYTIFELERIATEQLRCLPKPVIIPIDVEYLVEQLPCVDLDHYRCLRDNHQLNGMVGTDQDTGDIVIYIDENLATSEKLLRRYRMTVAEEFAHLILHRKAIEAVANPQDFYELHPLRPPPEAVQWRHLALFALDGRQLLEGDPQLLPLGRT